MTQSRLLPLLLVGLGLASSGCTINWGSATYFDEALLIHEGIGLDGQVFMLSPRNDAMIAVNPETRDFSAIEVGRQPALLSASPTEDILYTLDQGDDTLSRILPNGTREAIDLGAPFTSLVWSPDGSRGVAWFDPAESSEVVVEGSLNLNAYAVITIGEEGVSVDAASLTFEPHALVFTPDSQRLLVSTTARLHVIDLSASPSTELAIPFTTDESQNRAPSIVSASPDSQRALVTVTGMSDLFVVGLDPVMIENVAPLGQMATAVVWSADGSRAIIADGSSNVRFLDVDTNEIEVLSLPAGVTDIVMSQVSEAPFALLYDDRGWNRYITRVELTENSVAPDDPQTFLLEERVGQIELSPAEEAAVIIHDIDDLGDSLSAHSISLYHFAERAPSRIRLDSSVSDTLFLGAGVVAGSDDEHVFVTLPSSGRLVRYNLRTYAQVVLDTYARPQQIAPLGDGTNGLFVVHDQDVGLVSFLDADATEVPSGGFPAVAGMAFFNILDRS